MYHTILVPLDGSKRAEKILTHAEDLARRFKAGVVFLQVVRMPYFAGTEMTDVVLHQQELEQRIQNATSYLTTLQAEFEKKGIEAKMHVVTGPVVRSIIEWAEEENADLIAIASHGRTGLSRVFYGSVASGILNHLERPLLIIRSRDD